MSWYTDQTQDFLHQSTRNQPLWVYIPDGIPSVLNSKKKINLIKTLVHQAMLIKLGFEIEFIKRVLSENAYSMCIVESSIKEKCKNFRRLGRFVCRNVQSICA